MKTALQWIKWVALATIILVLLVVTFVAIDIYQFSLQDQTRAADVAIVLGAAVWDDEPSPVFRERINHAIDLYSQELVGAILFTGGKSAEDVLTEAEAAKDYAVQQGVLPEDIYIETKSTITFENLLFAKQIVDQEEFDMILVVSDPLHMKRVMVLASDLGLDAFSSPTPTSLYQSFRAKGGFLMRETYFLISYYLQAL